MSRQKKIYLYGGVLLAQVLALAAFVMAHGRFMQQAQTVYLRINHTELYRAFPHRTMRLRTELERNFPVPDLNRDYRRGDRLYLMLHVDEQGFITADGLSDLPNDDQLYIEVRAIWPSFEGKIRVETGLEHYSIDGYLADGAEPLLAALETSILEQQKRQKDCLADEQCDSDDLVIELQSKLSAEPLDPDNSSDRFPDEPWLANIHQARVWAEVKTHRGAAYLTDLYIDDLRLRQAVDNFQSLVDTLPPETASDPAENASRGSGQVAPVEEASDHRPPAPAEP